MSQYLRRARHLISQSRFDLAEPELRRALLEDPSDYEPHALIALCLSHGPRERLEEAESAARQAVHLAPDVAFVHANLARVLALSKKLKEAREAADSAIRLDPNEAWHHAVLAMIWYQGQRWQEAVESAEQGLRLDPEDQDCLNLRSAALTNMGRGEEAAVAIEQALRNDPMNATSHANRGWSLLRERKYKDALEHFREALRIDPEHEWAKSGLVEALKARHLIYRILLFYGFWLMSLSDRARMGVLIGGYVLYRLLGVLADRQPQLAPYVLPLLYAYVAFALLTWWGNAFFETLLRFNKYGRYALTPRARLASNWFIALFSLAVAALVMWLVTDSSPAFATAFITACLIVPVTQACNTVQRVERQKRIWVTLGLAAIGLVAIVADAFELPITLTVFQGFIYAFIAYMLLGNILTARRPSM